MGKNGLHIVDAVESHREAFRPSAQWVSNLLVVIPFERAKRELASFPLRHGRFRKGKTSGFRCRNSKRQHAVFPERMTRNRGIRQY